MLLGAHESISGGCHKAFPRAVADGCEAMQIFTKNASQWVQRDLTEDEVGDFKSAWKESGIGPVAAHDSYLINLASPKKDLYEKSRKAFLVEVRRAEALGIQQLIFHPGSHTGAGADPGIERIVDALAWVLDQSKGAKVRILLETTAGMGSSIGGRFSELGRILDALDEDGRTGACYDTCHTFAAGYDIRTAEAYDLTMSKWNDDVGTKRLQAFHLNDSVKGLGEHLDRHSQIGEGAIGLEGFRLLVNDRRFEKHPGYLETPPLESGEDSYRRNLAVLRKLEAGG